MTPPRDRSPDDEALPTELAIDAWTGSEGAHGAVDPRGDRWGARRESLPPSQAALPFGAPADEKDWRHKDVGYAVLLRDPDDDSMTPADRARADDAEQPIRDLVAARPGTVVLRWRPELGTTHLRRYFDDGTAQDPQIGLTTFGVAKNRLPRYVLIVGGPEAIPWSVQYALGTRHAVGRLPLTGDALANYVHALLTDWQDHPVDVQAPVLWSVDHGGGDITTLMRKTITGPLATAMQGTLARMRHLTGADATTAELATALGERHPALVVTSSHGRTGPLEQPAVMAAQLGLPVDVGLLTVPLETLDAAMPAGAVWYAQACCSAGSDGVSHYTGLLSPGTSVFATLTAVAGLGAGVAPAPLRLLGRPNPVRAVLGHVEPTFDWTLRSVQTGQSLGGDIVKALTSNAFHGAPLGLAFEDYRAGVGQLHTDWADLQQVLAAGDTSVRERLTWLRLTALDRQALVLLGDPTVTLPPLV